MSTQREDDSKRDPSRKKKPRPLPNNDVRILIVPESALEYVWLNLNSDRRGNVVTSIADAVGNLLSTQSHAINAGKSSVRIYVGHLEPGEYSLRTTLHQALYVNSFLKVESKHHPR